MKTILICDNGRVAETAPICRKYGFGLGSRIGYVHLHDNQGKEDEHLGLGRGSIPMVETLHCLQECCPQAVWAIEAHELGIEQSIEWLDARGFLERPA